MIRIGKMTDYALVLTNRLVRSGRELSTTDQLAEETGLPFATVRKLLKQLVDGKIVQSFRGTRGGYRLNKEANELNIADVIAAIEGPIAITECSATGGCKGSYHCNLIENWNVINSMVLGLFEKISLEDMAKRMNPANTSLSCGALQTPLFIDLL